MTLRELGESALRFLESTIDWFESGFCNSFAPKHHPFPICEQYARQFGDLTLGQALFTAMVFVVFANTLGKKIL